jgi:hypothetical protein
MPYLIERGIDSTYGVAARDTEHPERLEELLKKERKTRYSQSDSASGDRQSPSDLGEESSEIRQIMTAGIRAAFEGNGSKAVAQDIGLAMSDWGFKLEDVKMEKGKLVIWHPPNDSKKPLEVAARAHVLLRRSELRVHDETAEIGDTLVMERIEEVLDTLLERLQ